MYRPFDDRFTFFTGKSKGFVAYPRKEMFSHLNKSTNISLITCRQQSSFDFQHIYVSRLVSDMCNISSQTKETGYIFPLYLYPETTLEGDSERVPNLNMEIVEKIAEKINHAFVPDSNILVDLMPPYDGTLYPEDILDYIYAVLHSPSYREKYKEFLKIDFPRVPYPKDAESFWKLVELGREIREIHLLESPVVEQYITQYPEDGDNVVDKPVYKGGNVYINSSQYFAGVPEVAWNFYIGGYQPAQKWLKDRKGRTLDFEDILHYQKIIVALTETDRLMRMVDEVMASYTNAQK